jgi:hypothetical protein
MANKPGTSDMKVVARGRKTDERTTERVAIDAFQSPRPRRKKMRWSSAAQIRDNSTIEARTAVKEKPKSLMKTAPR